MKTLNVYGCGKVARVLARLWSERGCFAVQDICNRTLASAGNAVAFIGAGNAIDDPADFRTADVWLIGSGDDAIMHCAEVLARDGKLTQGALVFHCSGALSSQALNSAAGCGAAVASVHPIRSFANPEQSLKEFHGTWCGIEGDAAALALLGEMFEAIGAKLAPIDADAKILYHAGAVFASNYLVTLLDAATQAYVAAGVPQDAALQMMAPLVRGAVDNVFSLGTTGALTGPIARGDMETARRQQQAVAQWNSDYGRLYEDFLQLTAALAARRNLRQ
jgi:predicted short-subunit dehydrogenase-like oxidoreductase (DUF2520 family)